jgi:hypothetical protein
MKVMDDDNVAPKLRILAGAILSEIVEEGYKQLFNKE